ncbi:MAG: hypothetical protein A4E28_01953 [Methanocella sp. PtaU1.Bin125]|nr:MAG: hypothetical protein A4E28_01953 [Methanocella sp. PtaU1.Bin125]
MPLHSPVVNPLKLSQIHILTHINLYSMMFPSRKKSRYIVKSPDGQVDEIPGTADDARLPVDEPEEVFRQSRLD